MVSGPRDPCELSTPGKGTSNPCFFMNASTTVYVEWIQQYVFKTSSGISLQRANCGVCAFERAKWSEKEKTVNRNWKKRLKKRRILSRDKALTHATCTLMMWLASLAKWMVSKSSYLVWTQSMGFPTYCRVVTAMENVTSNITVAFVCRRKTAESVFTWFAYSKHIIWGARHVEETENYQERNQSNRFTGEMLMFGQWNALNGSWRKNKNNVKRLLHHHCLLTGFNQFSNSQNLPFNQPEIQLKIWANRK